MSLSRHYLDQMKKRLPKEIQEPDRTWFALAAYNVGFGHLRDAMNLARQLKKDPYTSGEISKPSYPFFHEKPIIKISLTDMPEEQSRSDTWNAFAITRTCWNDNTRKFKK